MNRFRRILCCAVVGIFVVALETKAIAQDENSPSPALSAAQSVLVEPSRAVDQPAQGATAADDFCSCLDETESATVTRIEQALLNQLKSSGLDFTDTPLEEVVAMLQQDYGIPIQLDRPSLDEIGLNAAEPVNANLHNISLRSALRLILEQMQLTYIIRDEVLLITTPDEAESDLLTCVYDVRSIDEDASVKTMDSLIDTIVACIAKESWAENGGGEAEIRPLKSGLLVISQSRAVHEEIRGLLSSIRNLRNKQPEPADAAAAASPDDNQVVTRSYVLQIGQPDDFDKLRPELRELIVQAIPDQRWAGRLEDGQSVVLSVLPDRIVLRHKSEVQHAVQSLLSDSGVATVAPHDQDSSARGSSGGGLFRIDPDNAD